MSEGSLLWDTQTDQEMLSEYPKLRSSCQKCDAPSTGAKLMDLKPGNWICQGCVDLAFARKTACTMLCTEQDWNKSLSGGSDGTDAKVAPISDPPVLGLNPEPPPMPVPMPMSTPPQETGPPAVMDSSGQGGDEPNSSTIINLWVPHQGVADRKVFRGKGSRPLSPPFPKIH